MVRDRSDKPIKRRRVLTSKPLRMTGHLCGFEDGCRRFYSERVGNGYGNGAVSLGPQPGKKKGKSFHPIISGCSVGALWWHICSRQIANWI